ncbi:PREDICTED: probable mediator of RNA polymerase II transcription subunit 26a [Nelumbo nucifera]|uniref:TFIIS N-terminal domain-containing protein n=2 Tax=Nelumbo nucifera TaxID=4432 RepID=A0A822XZA4_NELNU|nr:PREDICTED: probable mediator of RNA polymerase II transcription subunit 26a [Nelumbo nucifera]DAD26964.1 TPA_asm: hypothetical protein HUJ06_028432 [Nelumbo nucifera]
MAASEASLVDFWRKFFQGAHRDIFTVIEKAITVASLDRPDEFKRNKLRIIEALFSYGMKNGSSGRCIGSDSMQSEVVAERDCNEKKIIESNVSCSTNNGSNDQTEEVVKPKKIEGDDKTDEIAEVLRIKVAVNYNGHPDEKSLLETLGRLQGMELSFQTLKATEIGTAVNEIRKQTKSKKVRKVARAIIERWRATVDQWLEKENKALSSVSTQATMSSIEFEATQSDERTKMQQGPTITTYTVCEKSETTKRNLQDAYQRSENAKKQRCIKFLELQKLPKKPLPRGAI